MSKWMIGKMLMKQEKERRILQQLKYERCYRCRLHAGERVWKNFEIKNLGEYHDLYLKSDTLLLADVFKNSRRMCLKIYHLDSDKFLSAP